MPRTKWEKIHEDIVASELQYLRKRQKERGSGFQKWVEKYVPEKLHAQLEAAFSKGFYLVFEKGVSLIEKTYSKEKYEMEYRVGSFDKERNLTGSLAKLEKGAAAVERRNKAFAGVEGLGLGVLGIGLPDIPLFIGALLKNVYEIALTYGFSYDSEREKIFILKLIRTSLCRGERLIAENRSVGRMICGGNRDLESFDDEIQRTAGALSDRLLYLKFVQGLPIVGVVGGVSDMVVMGEVTEYAKLMYKKRYLRRIWEEKRGRG